VHDCHQLKAVQKINVVRVDEPLELIPNDRRKNLYFINAEIQANGEFAGVATRPVSTD
jgi:hypothetical protein